MIFWILGWSSFILGFGAFFCLTGLVWFLAGGLAMF